MAEDPKEPKDGGDGGGGGGGDQSSGDQGSGDQSSGDQGSGDQGSGSVVDTTDSTGSKDLDFPLSEFHKTAAEVAKLDQAKEQATSNAEKERIDGQIREMSAHYQELADDIQTLRKIDREVKPK